MSSIPVLLYFVAVYCSIVLFRIYLVIVANVPSSRSIASRVFGYRLLKYHLYLGTVYFISVLG
jgi:hypothetical protein